MNLWTHLREARWRGKPRKMIRYVARRVFVVQQWCASVLKPTGGEKNKKQKTHRVLFQQQKRRVWNNDTLRVSFNPNPPQKNPLGTDLLWSKGSNVWAFPSCNKPSSQILLEFTEIQQMFDQPSNCTFPALIQRISEAQCAINIIYGHVLEGLHAFIYNLCPRLPLYLLLKSCAWCFSSCTTVIYRFYVLSWEWSLAAEAALLKQPIPPVFLHTMVCLLGSVNHNINIKSWCQRNITRLLSCKKKGKKKKHISPHAAEEFLHFSRRL